MGFYWKIEERKNEIKITNKWKVKWEDWETWAVEIDLVVVEIASLLTDDVVVDNGVVVWSMIVVVSIKFEEDVVWPSIVESFVFCLVDNDDDDDEIPIVWVDDETIALVGANVIVSAGNEYTFVNGMNEFIWDFNDSYDFLSFSFNFYFCFVFFF